MGSKAHKPVGFFWWMALQFGWIYGVGILKRRTVRVLSTL